MEVFHRCSTPRLHPVLYYILAGAYSGPLQVIDLPSASETWYQVANPSSLVKRMVRNPPLTLLDAHSQVHGTSPLLQGPIEDTDPNPPSLTPYYPPLPVASTPPVDRAAFGSDALTRFLQVAPDSFPVNPPVAPPLPDEFRMVYLNVNGIDGFKFAELLMFMALEAVDCMVLIDVCVAKERVFFLRREARAHLGPRAECRVSVPAEESGTGVPPPSIKVGGNAIILNNRWGPQLAHYKSDPSHLSLVDEALLTIPGGRLQVLAMYWPFPPAHSPVPPEDTGLSSSFRRGLYHRLSHYLNAQGSKVTPLDYTRDTIQHWAHRHMSPPGNYSICGGDFYSL